MTASHIGESVANLSLCRNRCGRPATPRHVFAASPLATMVQIIDQLSRDHRNMRLLLDIIEEEMNAYRDGRVPDFDLLRMIAEYTLDYPTLVHHPKEDLVFDRLVMRDPEAKAIIDHLVQEHKELSELTRTFAAAISNVARDIELSREWLDSLASKYLLASRTHMQTEETHFLPRAAVTLTNEDWLEIEQNVIHTEDPMFGKKVAEAYLFLYERIVTLRG
jgi:hemerythrin-like domain-containing protein